MMGRCPLEALWGWALRPGCSQGGAQGRPGLEHAPAIFREIFLSPPTGAARPGGQERGWQKAPLCRSSCLGSLHKIPSGTAEPSKVCSAQASRMSSLPSQFELLPFMPWLPSPRPPQQALLPWSPPGPPPQQLLGKECVPHWCQGTQQPSRQPHPSGPGMERKETPKVFLPRS